jgi:hypothetical protein
MFSRTTATKTAAALAVGGRESGFGGDVHMRLALLHVQHGGNGERRTVGAAPESILAAKPGEKCAPSRVAGRKQVAR